MMEPILGSQFVWLMFIRGPILASENRGSGELINFHLRGKLKAVGRFNAKAQRREDRSKSRNARVILPRRSALRLGVLTLTARGPRDQRRLEGSRRRLG